MKTGTTSLNANAAAYIPLSQRGAAGENREHSLTAEGSGSRNATAAFGYHPANTTVNYHPSKAFQIYPGQNNSTSDVYPWKSNNSHGSYASSSKSPKVALQKDFLDEEFDMDLAYLQMTFPDFSDESLSHIYLANGGDLETTVEMLNQLELGTDDSPEFLPDTLEIGDISESQSSKECTSSKLKEVADEISGSSGSSNQHPVQN